MEEPKIELYLCACHGDGISLEKSYKNEIYLALWTRGHSGKHPLWSRLRFCWKMLIEGKPWNDEIIFNDTQAAKVGKHLISLSKMKVDNND